MQVKRVVLWTECYMGADSQCLNLLHLMQIVSLNSRMPKHCFVLHPHDLRIILLLDKHNALFL